MVVKLGVKTREIVFIAQHKKRAKIVATRYLFCAQNVPKMLLRPRLRHEPRCGSSQRSPVPPNWIWGKGREQEGKGGEGEEGRRKESRGTEGRRGSGRKGVGKKGGWRSGPRVD